MNYYEINEDTARRAKQMRSFDDYCEGSATWQYRNRCDEAAALAEQVKTERCKTAAQREHIDYLLNRYCKVLAEATNKDNEIGTRCPSVMISGGGNFPVAKKEKQIAAWEKNAERYGYADSILNQIRYYAAVVKSDDPEALPVLKAQLDELTAMQEKMKAVNAYFRKNKTLDGCPDLLPEERKEIEELWERGIRISAPYPPYHLTNNNAAIKRVRERIERMEVAKASDSEVEHQGYTYKENGEAMRVQLIFPDKPDDETRTLLKSEGFRWSPRYGAWQRQLTPAGKMAARRVMNKLDEQETAE